VRALEREKYATWAWNYGCSPAYTQHKKRRFAFGGVQLLMQVDKGVLQALAIRGDFFGNGEVAALEQALAGVPLQAQAVRAALAGVDVAAYIHGMDGEKLAELLLH
jgi:lipoate-protein ligase A